MILTYTSLDWLQSPVTKFFFLIILFDNIKLVTSLYSHDIILVLFQWIIKQDYKEKKWSLETGASLIPPLKGLDKLGRVAIILYKGDNFCNYLFALLYTQSSQKMDLL